MSWANSGETLAALRPPERNRYYLRVNFAVLFVLRANSTPACDQNLRDSVEPSSPPSCDYPADPSVRYGYTSNLRVRGRQRNAHRSATALEIRILMPPGTPGREHLPHVCYKIAAFDEDSRNFRILPR